MNFVILFFYVDALNKSYVNKCLIVLDLFKQNDGLANWSQTHSMSGRE